ncbi:MAG: hypothetical protein QW165_02000 [Candidatus Woesearchaeota archaeon]
MTKRGQITIFIIIGIVLLFIIGTAIYLSTRETRKPFEAARPTIATVPQEVQPLRDFVESCIKRLATDGLRKIGDSGGYVDQKYLTYNILSPTEGEAVQMSPKAGPAVAYWWHLQSSNNCKAPNCVFGSKRPGLRRGEGQINIESQLDEYVTNNLRSCLGTFEDYQKRGCTVQELGEPKVTANVAQEDVFFVGKYPLRAVCGSQSFDIEDTYVSIDLNLREIYNLATTLTNYQKDNRFLESATKTLIYSFSDVDPQKLPPPRDFEVGPPKPGVFWIKSEVGKKLQDIIAAYIPIIQTSSVRNYRYISAPADVRDPESFENFYNRQFFIPLNESHPDLTVRFSYLDWWKPYFQLNCNGELCRADTATNFAILPLTINRYEFAYDFSYPVLVEIRNPDAFNQEGYSFNFMLEQNLRDAEAFTTDIPEFQAAAARTIPSIFCDPAQRTSGMINIFVKDAENLKGLSDASISYICGQQSCTIGQTREGNFAGKFPRCIGGILRVTKDGYASYSAPLDTQREEPLSTELLLEPVRILNATIRNYALTKQSKRGQWDFREGGSLRPPEEQDTSIQLVRKGNSWEEPFSSVVSLEGDEIGELTIIPGNYTININSFLRKELIIPPDERCFKIKKLIGSKKKCFWVPQKPIVFNETSPFPYGGAEYEYEITSSMLRGKSKIEFKQFIIAIDRIPEDQRIAEDLNQIDKVNMYAQSNLDRIYPVIT